MASKKAVKHHVMSHQTGYRTVVHDLNGKMVKEHPWVVTGVLAPTLFAPDESDEANETADEETAERRSGQS